MTAGANYRSVGDVLTAIRAAGGIRPNGAGEREALPVAAADLTAAADVPGADVARVAGWAVASLATVGAAADAPLPLDPPPRRVRIGDALGAGVDAVALPEAVEAAFGSVAAVMPVGPYEHVRRAGADARAGAVLVAAGTRLTALRRAGLRAAGLVVGDARPVTEDVSGSEVAPPAPEMLAAARVLLGGMGVEVLLSADPAADVGRLADAGATVVAARIAMRPGSETGLVIREGVAVLVVPALLDAIAAVRIGLLDALGESVQEEAPGALTGRVAGQVGTTDLVLVAREGERWTPLATGDWPLGALLKAGGCLVLPPDSEGSAAGTTVCPLSVEG